MICFYGEQFFAPHPTPKLEYHPLSAVRDCLFNIFAATFHIGGRSSILKLRTCHAGVTGTHLTWLYCILWWIYCNKWFRRCIVSMYNKHYCFLSSWCVSFLGSSGKVTYHASNFRWKFCVLKALQLFVGLKDMYNCCLQVYGIYIWMLKHQSLLNVYTVFCQINCLVFVLYITIIF